MGIFFSVRANIGLAPWHAFTVGFCNVTGLSYGRVNVGVGIGLLIITSFMKEPIGIGTAFNILLISLFVDFMAWMDLIPYIQSFWLGIPALLLGQVFTSLGSYFYMGAGLGCGPRDTLMVAMSKRFPGAPIGIVRGGIEFTVLTIGWLLGAKVGLGTIIAMFGISYILQITFSLLKFDVRKINYHSLGSK